jgi:hypothetical protein
MGTPNVEDFEAILRDRDVSMPRDRVESAVELHARLRPELDRLRAVRLEYLSPTIEPATALQWIENEGRSVPDPT